MAPQEFIGKVVSDRMRKSILVAVDSFHMSAKYKVMRKTTSKLMVHDELNECNVGDRVKITTCRPLSKHKAFLLKEILHREKVYDAKSVVAEMNVAAETRAASEAAMTVQQTVAGGISPPTTASSSGVGRGFAASAIP